MLISEDSSLSHYLIKSYSDEEITINDQKYQSSLIVTPEKLIPDWRPRKFEELSISDFSIFLELNPEFVLLGTGTYFHRLPNFLRDALADQLIIETMTTKAACRSFVALSSEGREVAAALIL